MRQDFGTRASDGTMLDQVPQRSSTLSSQICSDSFHLLLVVHRALLPSVSARAAGAHANASHFDVVHRWQLY